MIDWLRVLFDVSFAAAFFYILDIALKGEPKKNPEHKQEKQERIALFDVLKGVGIAAVVIMHTQAAIPFFILYSFAVPVFIFASGYLLMNRYHSGLDLASYLHKIVLRIVVAYFAIVCVLRAVTGFPLTPEDIAMDMAFGRVPYIQNSPSNYFIPMIILFYLLFPIILKFKRQALSLGALIASFAFAYLSEWIYAFFENIFYLDSLAYLTNIIMPFRYMFFFMFGIFIWQYDIRAMGKAKLGVVSKHLIYVLLLGTAAFGLIGFDKNVFIFPAAFSLIFLATYATVPRLSGWLEALGKQSLMIYLLHWAVFFTIRRIFFQGQEAGDPLLSIGVALIVLAASYFIAAAIGFAVWKVFGRKEEEGKGEKARKIEVVASA